ncbi:MAG: PQ-loop domain-containing transporter [Ilumatobacteraceae bacterium]|nr:PQ-loop domain-containing transporter [Ilumatobacteraceae bacterium]
MTLANLSGSIAALLGVVFIWPQVIRVYATQSVEGVSGLSHLIGMSGTLMWFTYAISTQSLPMLISNTNIEIAIIALMVMLVRKRALPLWLPATVFQ